MSFKMNEQRTDRKPLTLNSKPLSIAMVTETWRPDINGVAMTCGKMADGLAALGAKVQVIQTSTQSVADDPQFDVITFKRFKLPFYKDVALGIPNKSVLTKLWRENRPDIVLIVTEGPLGYSALRIAKKLNIPVVSEFHTNFQLYSKHYGVGFLEPMIRAYLRHFHNRAQKTLVPTPQTKQQLEQYGFDNLATVARGVDTTLFSAQRRSDALRKKWNIAADQLAVIYVGRIAPEKNIDLAIKAFRQLQKVYSDARFIVVGDGPIKRYIQAENNDFIFCGMQTDQDLAEHYASADLCLFPSTTETFGNVLLEAMASGLAVVCYDYAAAKTHVENQYNGASVELHNEEEFVRQTIALACNSELRSSMRQRAEQSIQQYGWDYIYADFIRNINTVIKNSAIKSHTKQTQISTEITESHSL